jgi:hypothetical protein
MKRKRISDFVISRVAPTLGKDSFSGARKRENLRKERYYGKSEKTTISV